MNSRAILNRVVENWPAKVLSIALAIVFYLFRQVGTLEERLLLIPLNIETTGELVPLGFSSRMMRVTIRGEHNSIFTITEQDIDVFADMRGITARGEYKVPVQFRKMGNAIGVIPLEIMVDPMELTVSLDTRNVKSVAVSPNFQGALQEGYEMGSFTIDPPNIEIEGPESIIREIAVISTDAIDLSGRNSGFTAQVQIINWDSRFIIRGSDSAVFRAEVHELVVTRDFEGIPVRVAGLDSRFTYEPISLSGSLRIEGEYHEYQRFVPGESTMTLDCSRINSAGDYTIPVTLDVPQPLRVIRYEPHEVQVEIILNADPFYNRQQQ